MSLTATVRALVLAGATPEMILAVVEAHEACASDALASRRARDAERQRAKRERDAHVMSRDVTVTVDDAVTTPAPPSSLPPGPPNLTTPTPPDITTRVKASPLAKPNGFARWWESYPNKVGKAAAEKAYARACVAIGGPDPPAVLLDGLERAKASRQWSEGYIPHPTTWLNQGRWDDEPAEINPRKANERTDHHQQPTHREDRLGRMLAGAMAAAD